MEIDESMLINVSGAGNEQASSNKELLNTLGENMAWGAGFGAIAGPVAGVAGAAGGAVTGAIQTVVQQAVEHGPVSVPIPVVPGANLERQRWRCIALYDR